MNQKYILAIFIFILSICFLGIDLSYADHVKIPETDTGAGSLYSYFDLRERETYIQVTNTANLDFIGDDDDEISPDDVSSDITVHVQIFNVDDNCNDNNFFDTLTPNDTHIYNISCQATPCATSGRPSWIVRPTWCSGDWPFMAASQSLISMYRRSASKEQTPICAAARPDRFPLVPVMRNLPLVPHLQAI